MMVLLMILFVVFFFIGGLLLGISYEFDGLKKQIIGMLSGFILIVLSIVSLVGAITIITKELDSKDEQLHKIYTLKSESFVSGNFYLGSGSINEDLYYIYYIKNERNEYYIGKVLEQETLIIESDDLEISLYSRRYTLQENILGFKRIKENTKSDRNYIIVVPTGTIIIDYNQTVKWQELTKQMKERMRCKYMI